MRLGRRFAAFCLITSTVCAQTKALPAGKSDKKLCVARVANSSGKPIAVDRVQQQWIDQLTQRNIDAIAAPTLTILANRLELTPANREAFHALKCDFMLLTEIAASTAANASIHGQGQGSLSLQFSVFARGNRPVLSASRPLASDDAERAAQAALLELSKQVANAISAKQK